MSRCAVGSLSDDPCHGTATHQARGWGYGPGSDEMDVCERHAWVALSDGARVLGPDGDDLAFDDDGEMVAALTLAEVP